MAKKTASKKKVLSKTSSKKPVKPAAKSSAKKVAKVAKKAASKAAKTVKKEKAVKSVKPQVKKVVSKVATKTASKAVSQPKAKSESSVKKTSGGNLLNKKSPSFSLFDSNNNQVSLSDFAGKKVVLYFYPKDSTPGCTLEGQQFSRLHKEFVKENTVILGVSKDSVSSHEKFKSKYNFPFELLSDEDGKLCEAFDVIKEKNMYGRKFMGIERSTFLLDENHVVVGEFRKISLAGHAEFILQEIRKLSS